MLRQLVDALWPADLAGRAAQHVQRGWVTTTVWTRASGTPTLARRSVSTRRVPRPGSPGSTTATPR